MDYVYIPAAYPLAYLITFTCYGTFLHGDDRTSVDRSHCAFDTPALPPNPRRVKAVRRQLKEPPYRLEEQRRQVVLEALKEASHARQRRLLAAHVRSNHVHVVVQAEREPEKILGTLKAHASLRLTQTGRDEPGSRRWTRHGSTQYLWREQNVESAIDYVLERQGRKMAFHEE